MSCKTFKELSPDESSIISGIDHILSLDTYIYQGQDRLQDKDSKENKASEAKLINSNKILNLCCKTDSLYSSKGDNQLYCVVWPIQPFEICSANVLM